MFPANESATTSVTTEHYAVLFEHAAFMHMRRLRAVGLQSYSPAKRKGHQIVDDGRDANQKDESGYVEGEAMDEGTDGR
jgi:hypothetical protein